MFAVAALFSIRIAETLLIVLVLVSLGCHNWDGIGLNSIAEAIEHVGHYSNGLLPRFLSFYWKKFYDGGGRGMPTVEEWKISFWQQRRDNKISRLVNGSSSVDNDADFRVADSIAFVIGGVVAQFHEYNWAQWIKLGFPGLNLEGQDAGSKYQEEHLAAVIDFTHRWIFCLEQLITLLGDEASMCMLRVPLGLV